MKVYVNDKADKRRIVDAELIKETKITVIVKMPDGKVISRKKKRDIPKESEAK